MSGFGSTQVEEDHHRSLPSKMNPSDSSSSTKRQRQMQSTRSLTGLAKAD
eukprot:COSAG03_NODE_14054_length_478_cov_1.467018_1_plen_49_part_01